MSQTLEVGSHEVPVFSVKREGFPPPPSDGIRVSSELDVQFFDNFLKTLIDRSLQPDDLVFSGFDGADIEQNPKLLAAANRYIWAMDANTWRKGIAHTLPESPADYAERYKTPCVGIYAKEQLRVVSADKVLEGEISPRQLSDAERLGFDLTKSLKALHDEHPDADIYDPVTNIDHPEGQLTDALRGLAFLEY